MKISNEVLLNAGDASGDLTSSAVAIPFVLGFNIQGVITGSPVGTIKLQGSSDPVPQGGNPLPNIPANWTDIVDSTQNINGSGSVVWNYDGSFFNWVRVVYTSSSGSGSLTLRMNTKGF